MGSAASKSFPQKESKDHIASYSVQDDGFECIENVDPKTESIQSHDHVNSSQQSRAADLNQEIINKHFETKIKCISKQLEASEKEKNDLSEKIKMLQLQYQESLEQSVSFSESSSIEIDTDDQMLQTEELTIETLNAAKPPRYPDTKYFISESQSSTSITETVSTFTQNRDSQALMNALPTHVDKLLPPLMLTHRYNESKPEKLETLIEFSREKLKIEPIITEEDEFDDETPFTPSQRTFETFQDAVSEIKRLEKELYDSSVRYERRISRLRARSAKNRAESAVKMFELQEEMRAALKEHQLAKRETAPTTTLPPTIKEIFSKQNELLAEIESLKNMLNSKNHLICELSMRIYDQDNAKSTEPLQKKDPEGPAKSTLRWSSAAYEEIEEKPINWTSIQNSLKESDDFINKFSASSLSGTIRPKISHLQFSNELNVQNLTPYPPPTTISPTSHKFRNNSHVARNMSAVNLKPIPRPEIVSASIADAANV